MSNSWEAPPDAEYDDDLLPPPTPSTIREEVPAYQPRAQVQVAPATCQHFFHSRNSTSTTATLKLNSHAAAPNLTPLYFNGSFLAGEVELNLTQKTTIRSIAIKVRGYSRGTTEGHDMNEVFFLAINHPVFPPAPPHGIEVPTSLLQSLLAAPKLTKGVHSWPFNIKLPSAYMHTAPGQEGKKVPLPPTFSQKGFPERLDYDIFLVVQRGALQSDDTISTKFRLLPRSRAKVPSIGRQMALAHGRAAPGPEDDMDGWTVTSTRIRGRIFNQRDIEVDCKFALPAPASYYRCNPVPFMVTLSSSDIQGLDLLASPKSLLIQLRQHIALRADSSKTAGTKSSTLVKPVSEGMFHNPSATARSASTSNGVRILEGLVGTGEGLLPGFDCPMMHLNYTITLSLTAVGFAPSSSMHYQHKDKSVLLSVPITVTTDAAPGLPQPEMDPPPPELFPASNGVNGHHYRNNEYSGFGFGDLPPPLMDGDGDIPSYEEVVRNGNGRRNGSADVGDDSEEHGNVIIGLAQ